MALTGIAQYLMKEYIFITYHTNRGHIFEAKGDLEVFWWNLRKVDAAMAQHCVSVDALVFRRENNARLGGANLLEVFLRQSPSEKRVEFSVETPSF